MGWIYKITSPNGRVYVGQTRNLKRRLLDYRFKKKKYNTIVFNSIKKHGWDSHLFEIIEEVHDDRLSEREMHWIKELNTYVYSNSMGMNMTIGGEGHRGTWMHDVERRKKQATVFSGEGNPFYGKTHSEATRNVLAKKASERNKKLGITVPKYGAEKGRLKCIKPVVAYDTNGLFLSEYSSFEDAANDLKVHRTCISESVKYHHFVNKKYTFRYKTDNYPSQITVGKVNAKQEKRPVVCFFKRKKTTYPSAAEASEALGVPKTTINRAALYNKGRPIRKGYVFVYEDLLESLNLA